MSECVVFLKMRLWWVSQEPVLSVWTVWCLSWCCVGCDVAPCDLCIIHQSPGLHSPLTRLQVGALKHRKCGVNKITLETNLFTMIRMSKVCQVFTWWHQICEVVLVKETLLWLKLVFWWHWSPSHPSISAQGVRLIGGGGGLGKFLHNIPSSWSKTIWRSDLSLWFITQLRASQVIIECHKMNF